MSEDRRRILEMLAKKKISVEEADSLLAAIESPTESDPQNGRGNGSDAPGKGKPKYLRVVLAGSGRDEPDKVNIRVPIRLLKAGMKLANLIPEAAHKKVSSKLKERGIDIDIFSVGPEMAEELLAQLCDTAVLVGNSNDKVRIFCE